MKRFEEMRDNVKELESLLMEADRRAREESAPYPPAYPFPVFGGEPVEERNDEADNRAILHQGLGGVEGSDKTGRETWDERCQRVTEDVDDDDDIEEDDGQPSEYDEWQDYMGGDEYYDHSESVWGEGY